MLREPGKGRKEEEEGGLLRTIGVKLWQGERGRWEESMGGLRRWNDSMQMQGGRGRKTSSGGEEEERRGRGVAAAERERGESR